MKIRITKTEGLFPNDPAPFDVYHNAFRGIEVDAAKDAQFPDHYMVVVERIIDALAEKGYLGATGEAVCSGRTFWTWFGRISNGYSLCYLPTHCCEVTQEH